MVSSRIPTIRFQSNAIAAIRPTSGTTVPARFAASRTWAAAFGGARSGALTTSLRARSSGLMLAEDENRVVPAEAEAVAHCHPHGQSARPVGNAIEVARRIRSLEVDRRRHDAVAECKDGERRLDCAGSAEAVPGRALRRGHGDRARLLLAQGELDGGGLCCVADAR